MKCKVCKLKAQGMFSIKIAEQCFLEGLNVDTLLRWLELEGCRIARSTWYSHFKHHENMMDIRKSNRSFRLRRHSKDTNTPTVDTSSKIVELIETCKS